jgi:hypothetical protein
MKNIHILPTDKPSRLYIDEGFLKFNSNYISENGYFINQNIYITSDEEIKEGDWILSKLNEVVRFGKKFNPLLYKKIILTTDQDLIKDGVWGIEDGFLEWFVKNPTCEYVELKGYAIILPGESCDCDNKCDTCKEEELTYTEAAEKEERIFNSNIGKQETLEDISTRYHQTAYGNLIKELTKQESTADYIDRHLVEAMVEVAKQKMYNEEDIFKFLDFINNRYYGSFSIDKEDLEDWFKQFKKK